MVSDYAMSLLCWLAEIAVCETELSLVDITRYCECIGQRILFIQNLALCKSFTYLLTSLLIHSKYCTNIFSLYLTCAVLII